MRLPSSTEVPKGCGKIKIMKNNMVKVVMVVEDNQMVAEIQVSKAFNNKASKYGTDEYRTLHKILRDNANNNPRIVIVKNEKKKTYNGLDFDKMAEYIKTQPDSEKMLIKFEAVKRIAEAKNAKYPLTKKWFLETFKEYKANAVSEAEAKGLEAQVKAEKEKLEKEKLEKEAMAEINAIENNTDKAVA